MCGHGNQQKVVFGGQISHKINGRKVGDRYGKDLELLVSMVTDLLPWQPKRMIFMARSGFFVGHYIAYDVMDDIMLPVTP